MSSAQTSRTTLVGGVVRWNRHWQMLVFAVAVIVAAASLEVLPDERVALHGLSDFPLPHLCMSRVMFDVSCPGCGLTRSFIHVAHAEWQSAWQVHHLGWLMAVLVVAQVPYRALILGSVFQPMSARSAQCLAFIVVGLLVSNWALSLLERIF